MECSKLNTMDEIYSPKYMKSGPQIGLSGKPSAFSPVQRTNPGCENLSSQIYGYQAPKWSMHSHEYYGETWCNNTNPKFGNGSMDLDNAYLMLEALKILIGPNLTSMALVPQPLLAPQPHINSPISTYEMTTKNLDFSGNLKLVHNEPLKSVGVKTDTTVSQ